MPGDHLLDGHTILYTFTTRGYAEFVLNLHASLSRAEPRLARVLVAFCPDDDTADVLRTGGVFAMTCEAGDLPDFAAFSASGFGRIVSYKYALARLLLDQAEYVWWCDGDIVAQAPMSERVAALMQRTGCDVLMQYEWPKAVFNVGFWIARRGPAVEAMLTEMTEYTASADADDQAHFNEVHVPAGRVRLAALNHDEFKCGNRFFFQHAFRPPRGRILHFNYTVGRLNKKSLMMGHRCWYLEEPLADRWRARLRHMALVVAARLGAEDPEGLVRDGVRAAVRAGRRVGAAVGR